MRAATICAADSLASRQTTVAPWAAAPVATASPIPDPAPITAAIFPSSRKSVLSSISSGLARP
jgi:hypothetical protein